MTAWLLLPQAEILSPLVSGQTHVTFLQAVPLYPHERAWKVVNGTDALMRTWQRETVPFWNPNRKPSALG